jgi:beta-galactosidase
VHKAHPTEWVSLTWPAARTIGSVRAYFTTDAHVSYLDGDRWVPVGGQQVDWATASNQPTTISFDPVTSTSVRLKLISPHPNESNGFFQIAELEVP